MMGRGRVSAPTRLTLKNAEKEIRPKHEYADPADDRHTLTNADTPHPESPIAGFWLLFGIRHWNFPFGSNILRN
jgi:hypothetical protein